MKLLDVNILVYAHREDVENHERYREWLENALSLEEGCALSELVLAGCLRIITHRKIFKPPTPLEMALRYVQALQSHPNVTILSPGPKHWSIFMRLCREGDARGNLVSDAYHAALAIETGCNWVSTDRDFARFPGLHWVHPFDEVES